LQIIDERLVLVVNINQVCFSILILKKNCNCKNVGFIKHFHVVQKFYILHNFMINIINIHDTCNSFKYSEESEDE